MTREEAISMLEQIGRHECIWMVCRHNEVYETIDIAIEALKERPHGKIVKDENGYPMCSRCGEKRSFWNFCPRCGADFREENENEIH